MFMNLIEVIVCVVVFMLLLSLVIYIQLRMGMHDIDDFAFSIFVGGLISVLLATLSSWLVHDVGLANGLLGIAIAGIVIVASILLVRLIKIRFNVSISTAIAFVASILFVLSCIIGIVYSIMTGSLF